MNGLTPPQLEMLLGGYATGTLSAEEHAALMRAALENQALFDALMDEEALRETLADSTTRQELLRALRPAEAPAKWWHKPWPWAALATAMVAVAVLVFVRKEPAVQTAKVDSVAEVQNQIAQAKPEPVPSEIAVPKRLQMRDAAPVAAPVVAAPVAGQMAAPPPPPAAPAPVRQVEDSRRDQPVLMADKAVGADSSAKKEAKEAVVVAAESVGFAAQEPAPLRVTVAFQQQDGTWRDVPAGGTAPAGRTLRLTVVAAMRGAVSLEPAVAPAQVVEPNRAATFLIAARAAGDLAFRVNLKEASLALPPGASALTMSRARQNAPRAEERAKVRAAEADNVAARPQAVLAMQEIRIKIE